MKSLSMLLIAGCVLSTTPCGWAHGEEKGPGADPVVSETENANGGVTPNTSGTYWFRVVDQDGKPVPGVVLEAQASTHAQRPGLAGPEPAFDIQTKKITSDALGDARVTQLRGHQFQCNIASLPEGFQEVDEQQGFFVQAGDTNGLSKEDPVGKGCDYIFHLLDARNAPQVLYWESESGGIPADLTSWSWDTLRPSQAGGATDQWKKRADFQIAVWRDPNATLVVRQGLNPQLPERDFPNENFAWRVQVRPVSGQVSSVVTGRLPSEAPAEGYVQEVRFEYAMNAERKRRGDAKFRFFWKVGAEKSRRYALVTMDIEPQVKVKDSSVSFKVRCAVLLNPAGCRRFGILRDDVASNSWVKQLEVDDPLRDQVGKDLDAAK